MYHSLDIVPHAHNGKVYVSHNCVQLTPFSAVHTTERRNFTKTVIANFLGTSLVDGDLTVFTPQPLTKHTLQLWRREEEDNILINRGTPSF